MTEDALVDLFSRGTVAENIVTIPITNSAEVLPASPRRLAVGWSTPLTNPYSVSTVPKQALGVGFTMQTTSGLYWLTVRDAGELVRRPWYGISQTAPQTISIFEIYAPE